MDIRDKIEAEMTEFAEKLEKAADKPIGDKSDKESSEEKARKEANKKKAQDPKSKEKNVDASDDAARADASESYQEKVSKGKDDRCWEGYKPVPGKKPYSEGSCVKKTDEKPEENGSTDEYDKEADPKKPYEPVKKPKIKLPDSAMKRKMKERAMEKSETAEMIQQILDSARAMGKEEFKKSVTGLSPEQQILVGKILEKGRKLAAIGTKSPDGKRVKTADGWKPVKGSGGSSKESKKEEPKSEGKKDPSREQIQEIKGKRSHEQAVKDFKAMKSQGLDDKGSSALEGNQSESAKKFVDILVGTNGLSMKQMSGNRLIIYTEKNEAMVDRAAKIAGLDAGKISNVADDGETRVLTIPLDSQGPNFKKSEQGETDMDLEKAMSAKDYAKKILTDKLQVQDVLKEAPNEMRDDILKELREMKEKTPGKEVKQLKGDMKKSTEFDDVAAPTPENEKDLPQEEVKDGNQYEWGDREDKKVIKENAASVNHQGDVSPEGRDGHEIADPKPQRDWEKFAEDYDSEKDQNPHAANLDAHAKIRKGENMEQLEEVLKSEDKSKMLMKRLMAKGMKKADCMAKMKKMGYDEAKMSKMWDEAEKEDQPEEKKMEKSLVWNDWQKDALGASVKRGRNAHYTVEEGLLKSEEERSERLAKGEFLNEVKGEKLEKSEEDETKPDLNDIIEKGFDRSRDQIEGAARLAGHKPFATTLTKSFEDAHIAATLGLSEEQVAEILGESKKTEE